MPKLKVLLSSPESRGVFVVYLQDIREVVRLDEQALRRAAAEGASPTASASAGPSTPPGPCPDPTAAGPSPWEEPALGAMALATTAERTTSSQLPPTHSHPPRPGAPSSEALSSELASRDVSSLMMSASLLTSSSAPLTGRGSAITATSSVPWGAGGNLTTAPSGSEGLELIDAAGNSLPQAVVAAIMLAWPGTNALARLKRRAALALAAAQEGPEGPHSMLASALGDVLHRYEPEAVAELRHPVTKTLRVKQLLHEGGPGDGMLSASPIAGSPEQQPGGAVAGGPGASPSTGRDGTGGANSPMPGDSPGGPGFLRVIKGKYDIVVALNVPGLLQGYAAGTLGQNSYGGGGLGAEASASSLPRQQSAGTLSPVRAHTPTSSHTSPDGRDGSRTASPLPGQTTGERTPGEGASMSPGEGGAGASGTGLQGASDRAGGAGSEANSVYGAEGVNDLALRAFPGTSPAAQLRRAIVIHLAGMPKRSQLWTHLGIFVASSQAHLWLNPTHRWPKLKAFVLHPDSRGVFLDTQMPGPASSAGHVTLDPAALRRAAAVGLASAISAAWPGHAPLERIRRAAAFTLAFAIRGPAGPYTMLGSALGTAIRKRDKEAFDSLAGMGKLSELLDDSAHSDRGPHWDAATSGSGGEADAVDPATAGDNRPPGGGYIVSFKKDQDGYMRLRLEALLQEWPREDVTSTAMAAMAAGLPAAGRFPLLPGAPDFSLADAADMAAFSVAAPGGATGYAGLAGAAGAYSSLLHGAGLPAVGVPALVPGVHTGVLPAAVSGMVGPDGGSPPLEQELLRRFPNPPGVSSSSSEQATIAAAKRCIARLLAWAPPPHQLTFAKLGAQVPKLLGGARIGRNLRLICLEEPDVFNVQSQSPTVHVVRLVCPRMLQLAADLSDRRTAQTAAQQQQQQAFPVMQAYMQAAHAQVQAQAHAAHSGGAAAAASALQQQLSGMLTLQEAASAGLGGAAGLGVQGVSGVQPAAGLAGRGAPSMVPQLPGLRIQTTASQRLLLQAQAQVQAQVAARQEQEAELRQQLQQVQVMNAAVSEHGGVTAARNAAAAAGGPGPSSWSAGWQPQPLRHPSLTPVHSRTEAATQQQQQQQQLLRMSQQALNTSRSVGGGVSATQLFDEQLSVGVTSPGTVSLNTTIAGGAEEAYTVAGSTLSARASVHLDASLPWQQQIGSSSSGMTQSPHITAPGGASTASGGSASGGHVSTRLHDFVAAALVAEQALQPPGSASASVLPATAVHVTADPYSSDFLAVLQHCLSCPQVGLAVQVCGGRPALVSLYAPSAMSLVAADGGVGAMPETLTPAVYVIDCTPSYGVEGSEVILGTLLGSLRGLLEEPGVAKVVHGCEQVRALEVLSGAAIAPLLDTRVLLDAVFTMLPPLPPPPSVSAVASAAAAGPLPAGGYSSVEAAAMAQLTQHVNGLRGVLQAVELWADRPELVSVLAGLHFAAYRAELWSAAGRDSVWLTRPLTESQVAVAAQAVHHLPELWAALCEAVPWLAAHAALRLMQHLRSVSPLRRHGAQG
ncbi:hypothetical protein GPECTOR_24g237 [Gonium pectorale]|uniref:Uncharacterized protein n=1 Tax=Gonium pectorale TaxID=33097 RepID=A0A150GGI3_GONPE|nr:hypothetical protein GPECTOR_24g237 [Gonium pectorale]|eukprot:KXZ48947.1 hypothetical protein GPECTOR_24g237 [Gonium pectorale]